MAEWSLWQSSWSWRVWSSWVDRLKLGLGSRWLLFSGRVYFWDCWKYSDLVIKKAVYSSYIFSWSRVYGIGKCHKRSHLVEDAVKKMDFSQISATIIFANNQGCITLTQNPVNHSCAKHIDIWHHFICEHVRMGEIDLWYISIKDMLANGFTKQLLYEAFKKFCSHLGVVLLTWYLDEWECCRIVCQCINVEDKYFWLLNKRMS